MTLHTQSASISHVGNKRELNEDAFYTNGAHGVWCVADGMGGYAAGEVASAMVVDAVAKAVSETSLQENLNSISAAILQVNSEMIPEEGLDSHPLMGSTVIVVVAGDQQCACLWAGDSRLYLFRDHLLYQMSKDHSLVQELVDQGVIEECEKQNHPKSNVITRAVGASSELELDRVYFDLLPSDQLLLCSDGLYNELSHDEIVQALAAEDTVENKTKRLLNQVLQGNANDNVTVSIVELMD